MSSQAERAATREEWKARVRQASEAVIPRPHFASDARISMTIFNLPDQPMQGDVDNIVKFILDALSRHIYLDDKQVERVVVQKFEPGNVFSFSNPSETFVRALAAPKPLVYIRISNDPFEDLI